MNPTAEEADAAQRRLNKIADTIDRNYHLVQLGPQVAEDIRTLTARRLLVETEADLSLRMFPPGSKGPTTGHPTVADWARKKRAQALGDETPWGDSQ